MLTLELKFDLFETEAHSISVLGLDDDPECGAPIFELECDGDARHFRTDAATVRVRRSWVPIRRAFEATVSAPGNAR